MAEGNNATVVLRGTPGPLKSALDESESNVKAFGASVKNVFAAIGTALAVRQVYEWAKTFVAAASEAQEADEELQNAIARTGAIAGFTAEQLREMAAQLQIITRFEAETTQGAQALLLQFTNIRGDMFVGAIKSAQDLATVFKGDLNTYARALGRALNDPIDALSQMERIGVKFTKSQEALINSFVKSGEVAEAQRVILDALRQSYAGAAEAAGGTNAGKLAIFRNRLGDIQETLGGMLLPLLSALVLPMEELATLFENLVPHIENAVSATDGFGSIIQSTLAPVLTWLIDNITNAFAYAAIAITDFASVAEKGMLTFQLTFFKAFGEVKHWLTDVVPAAASWLAENWLNIFTDLGSGISHVLFNIMDNLVKFMQSIKDVVTGKGWNFEFTALSEGFESTLTKFPEIAERVAGGTEKELGSRLDAVNNKLAERQKQTVDEIRATYENLFKPGEITSTVSMKPTVSDKGFAVSTKDDKKTKEEKEKVDGWGWGDFKTKDDKKKDNTFESSVEDLQSLNKRIASAAASGGDPVEKAVKEQVNVAKEMKDLQKWTLETQKGIEFGVNMLYEGFMGTKGLQ